MATANHEAAAFDRSTWHRTSAALIGMAEDEPLVRGKIAEHHAKLNVVSLTSRILIEAGVSECPFGTGEMPADIDLSRLMAKASTIFSLGGYSDAIQYGGMKPELRISPAGQVLIDPTFFDVIVEPAGRSLADKVIDEHRERYTSLLREPDLEAQPLDDIVEGEFLGAWQDEVGASLADCRGAVEALENKLVEAGVGWEITSRPELIAFLDGHIQDPKAYVAALEFVPSERLETCSDPFPRARPTALAFSSPLGRISSSAHTPFQFEQRSCAGRAGDLAGVPPRDDAQLLRCRDGSGALDLQKNATVVEPRSGSRGEGLRAIGIHRVAEDGMECRSKEEILGDSRKSTTARPWGHRCFGVAARWSNCCA